MRSRRLAMVAVAVPGDHFDPLQRIRLGGKCRIGELVEKPLTEFVTRQFLRRLTLTNLDVSLAHSNSPNPRLAPGWSAPMIAAEARASRCANHRHGQAPPRLLRGGYQRWCSWVAAATSQRSLRQLLRLRAAAAPNAASAARQQ